MKWLLGEYGIFWSHDACTWRRTQTISRFRLKHSIMEIDNYFTKHESPLFCEIVQMKTGKVMGFWKRHISTFNFPRLVIAGPPICDPPT